MKKLSEAPKIKKHFHKIDSKRPRDSNQYISDWVGITDRLKHNMGCSNQPQAEEEVQNTKTQVTSKTLKKNDGFKSTIVAAVRLNFKQAIWYFTW